ncbi:MAG: hypothetical protein HOP08_16050 [Cyclobacteriaceae bacterium]|nr:hypothetical protein [Cyclobacteriaceae bacterium]
MQSKQITFKALLFFLVIFISATQNVKAQKSLTGEWKMDWQKIYVAMTQPEKQRFDKMPQQMKNDISSNYSSKQFHFKQDNIIEVRWQGRSGEKIQTGTWELYGSVVTITIDEVPKQYTMSRHNNVLTLEIQEKMETALVSKLVFVRK